MFVRALPKVGPLGRWACDLFSAWLQPAVPGRLLTIMVTVATGSPARQWLKLRISPSIFLLILSYICQDLAVLERVPFQLGNWMLFLFSWVLPLMAITVAIYQLIRHRSLQHAAESVLAVWLLFRAFTLIVKASA